MAENWMMDYKFKISVAILLMSADLFLIYTHIHTSVQHRTFNAAYDNFKDAGMVICNIKSGFSVAM